MILPVIVFFPMERISCTVRAAVRCSLVCFCRDCSSFCFFLNGSLCGAQRLFCLSDLGGHIFQPLLFLCHLELGHSQMFFSAATLSTLHIGISGSFHIVEEIVLQDTVRCPQDFLALGGQKRIALLIQSNFGFPTFSRLTCIMVSLTVPTRTYPCTASTRESVFPPPGHRPHEGGSGTHPAPELPT